MKRKMLCFRLRKNIDLLFQCTKSYILTVLLSQGVPVQEAGPNGGAEFYCFEMSVQDFEERNSGRNTGMDN
jgi:hypothetical protein